MKRRWLLPIMLGMSLFGITACEYDDHRHAHGRDWRYDRDWDRDDWHRDRDWDDRNWDRGDRDWHRGDRDWDRDHDHD